MKKSQIGIVAALFIVFMVLPYLIAWRGGGSSSVFGGFLLNPLDGNSYLAKMYEGWRGSWMFTLPYSVEPGEGAYLFLFYLILGHLARWVGLPLLLVFHLARIIAAGLLLWTLMAFFFSIIQNKRMAFQAFILAAFGAGLGWLVYPFTHQLTSDFWVAEAYPFLSAYANAHFPLAISIMLWLFIQPREEIYFREIILRTLGGLFLGILLPFGIVITGVVLTSVTVWSGWVKKQFNWKTAFFPLLGGGPVLIYQLWVITTHPGLNAWNAQNITPTPPIWDLIVSLSPALPLAVIGAFGILRSADRGQRLLLVWSLAALILLLIPFSLQRRFITGLFIPLAGLAAFGIDLLARHTVDRFRMIGTAASILSFPTLFIVLIVGWVGMQTRDPALYLSYAEDQALRWVVDHTSPDAVILAAPETGLYIPAWTGRRVLYGHPFETIEAAAQKEEVLRLLAELSKTAQPAPGLRKARIDYVFYGPREGKLVSAPKSENLAIVYQNLGVSIYHVRP